MCGTYQLSVAECVFCDAVAEELLAAAAVVPVPAFSASCSHCKPPDNEPPVHG